MIPWERLQARSSAIQQRWLRAILASYAERAAAAFASQQDPFANPVGQALRAGTCAAVDALLAGKPPREVGQCLEEIIKIRLVQEFSPSRAVSFVFSLKDVVRAELGPAGWGEAAEGCGDDRSAGGPWAEFDRYIDEIALDVFDIYLGYRQQVYELRVNEVKRSVAKLLEGRKRPSPCPDLGEPLPQPAASRRAEAERGGQR